MLKMRYSCLCSYSGTRLMLDNTLQRLIFLLLQSPAAILSRPLAQSPSQQRARTSERNPLVGWDYRTASRRGGVSTKRGGSWMGRPGRAGRGVRLGGGGAGEA